MSSSSIDGIIHWESGSRQTKSDEVAEEEPLEIRIRGRAISVAMRTPGHDAELAAGFLLSEGVIHKPADILEIQPCEQNEHGNVINVLLAADVPTDFARLTRHVFAASSCGLCGKATIDSIRSRLPPIARNDLPIVKASALVKMPETMRQTQSAFDRTGGLHAAALFDALGNLIVLHEDVGRHNAVDKVLGYAMLNSVLPLDRHVVLVSGRSSFEIMQKALAAGVPVLAAVSAPSSLAVRFALESNQTLIGFLRGLRMNVYSGSQRVDFD